MSHLLTFLLTIVGCTELPLILKQADIVTPLLDTFDLHVRVALDILWRLRQTQTTSSPDERPIDSHNRQVKAALP